MAIYRVVVDLDCGNKPGARGGILYAGSLTRLEWMRPEGIEKLMSIGVVSRAATPPLAVLPGWKVRAGRLQQIGIVTVEDLIEADVAQVQEHMEVKRAETIEKWKTDVTKEILVSAQPPKRRR